MHDQAHKHTTNIAGYLFFFLFSWGGFALSAEASEDAHKAAVGKDAVGHVGNSLGHGGETAKRLFAGLKFSGVASLAGHGGTTSLLGGGVFMEYALIPHFLELELEFRVLQSAHGMAIPIDFLLKVPFHLGSHVALYLGIGPTLLIESVASEDTTHEHELRTKTNTHQVGGGVSAVFGADIWFEKHWGFVMEVHGGVVYVADAPVYDVGLSSGLIARW